MTEDLILSTIATFITQVGFPIFVAVWMLYKSSTDTEALKETVNELKTAIVELSVILKGEHNTNE